MCVCLRHFSISTKIAIHFIDLFMGHYSQIDEPDSNWWLLLKAEIFHFNDLFALFHFNEKHSEKRFNRLRMCEAYLNAYGTEGTNYYSFFFKTFFLFFYWNGFGKSPNIKLNHSIQLRHNHVWWAQNNRLNHVQSIVQLRYKWTLTTLYQPLLLATNKIIAVRA